MQPVGRRERLRAMKTSAVAGALIGLLVLTSCGSSSSADGSDDSAVDEPAVAVDPSSPAGSDGGDGAMPNQVAPLAGPVLGIGTVLDPSGSEGGPQLCLGAVAESAPPQCEGLALDDWSWQPVINTYESIGGSRWGSYAVTGTFDGAALTVTAEPQTLVLYDTAAPELPDRFVTSCSTPEGGWAVVDQDRISYSDQDAALAEALQLPGYAGSFLQSIKSAADTTRQPENASQTILNVLVTEDLAGARTRLEAVWGGPLCVGEAARSEQELLTIQGELGDLPGLLSSGVETDQVVATVVWDDGTLQEWADATYGADVVVIDSALEPVG